MDPVDLEDIREELKRRAGWSAIFVELGSPAWRLMQNFVMPR